ncbi:hypothetical protein [Roseomonas chloroacetimidivorans]|uniref:hypothetical protein n=1 Tax=Roseomonas chloroacetimidivorans TaxID=1766656 RepID=UPI003C73D17C
MSEKQNVLNRLAEVAPFWGLRPGSNEWPDFEIVLSDGGAVVAQGSDADMACRLGLLCAEHRPGEGLVIKTAEETFHCDWRYLRPTAPAASREEGK